MTMVRNSTFQFQFHHASLVTGPCQLKISDHDNATITTILTQYGEIQPAPTESEGHNSC